MSQDKKDDEEKKKLKCESCAEELEKDHIGVRCYNGHHLCDDCTKTFVKSVMGDPQSCIPPKCGYCGVDICPQSFERQLNDDQQSSYMTVQIIKQLQEGEEIVHCAFCSYMEVRAVVGCGDINFCHCQKEGCTKVSCVICHKECLRIDEADDDDEAYMQAVESREEHFHCVERDVKWGALTREFATALSSGNEMKCPGCGLSGTKDPECTHMTCPNCSVVWCYVCGLSEDDCDKAEQGGRPIYRHNVNWHSKASRCPMYLSEISQTDKSWPEDDDDSVQHFHRLRTLRLLREFYDKHGKETYDAMVAEYPKYGAACGFTENQIQAVDLTRPLFSRAQDGEFEVVEED